MLREKVALQPGDSVQYLMMTMMMMMMMMVMLMLCLWCTRGWRLGVEGEGGPAARRLSAVSDDDDDDDDDDDGDVDVVSVVYQRMEAGC